MQSDGRPIVADPNGNAACACNTECPFYYRATSCNPGTCRAEINIYFCGTFQCDSQTGNGPPLNGQIVRVVRDDLCYAVNTTIKYSSQDPPPSGQQSLPPGARIIPLADLSCMPIEARCEDCRALFGFYPMNPCGCSQGTSSGTSIFINCQCWANSPFPCPVYKYVDPISGQTSCWTKADAPPVEELPPGGVDVCGTPYPDCCSCCNPQCCSCSNNYPVGVPPGNCQQTTTIHANQSVSVITRPYGCCWENGTEFVTGNGAVEYFYGPGETNRYRRVQFKASGRTLTIIDTSYDPSTGVVTGTSYDYETLGTCGTFFVGFGSLVIVTSAFGPGAAYPDVSNGRVIERCDMFSWNFKNVIQPGSSVIKGSGSLSIVGSPGNCNGSPCSGGSAGDGTRGCSGCATIASAAGALDL